ncbi:MAG: hypothetical protein IPM95_00175 [Sphingobacteriales bacterium]|nr:hypothetical protein [Sphingobacteriales bacterium]
MLGEDKVDITEFVVNKSYIPIYCNGRIDKLINPKPHSFSKIEIDTIKRELNNWLLENNIKPLINDSFSLHKSDYTYSYVIEYTPIDVYMIKLNINNDSFVNVFFRYDNKLILPFSNEGWVLNECDK